MLAEAFKYTQTYVYTHQITYMYVAKHQMGVWSGDLTTNYYCTKHLSLYLYFYRKKICVVLPFRRLFLNYHGGS